MIQVRDQNEILINRQSRRFEGTSVMCLQYRLTRTLILDLTLTRSMTGMLREITKTTVKVDNSCLSLPLPRNKRTFFFTLYYKLLSQIRNIF